MKMNKLAFFLLLFLYQQSFAQKDTLTREDTRGLISQFNLDTVRVLNEFGNKACTCIGSIKMKKKDDKQIAAEIAKCIDKQIIPFQSIMGVNRAMKDNTSTITINTDKGSDEYRMYYYRIEEWLADTCTAMKSAVVNNNKETKFSVSKDKRAKEQYSHGENLLKNELYEDALPFFQKAVDIDPKFAFAWDDLGICQRRLGNLDAALDAYNRSLALDSTGKVPLQNIAVVYEYKKDYDKAIEAYKNLSKNYPEDPEAYYGTGRMYEMKEDYEKALDYMCKAYNAYIDINSPYRVDAQTNINIYHKKLKDLGKEELFFKILKDNHIKSQ